MNFEASVQSPTSYNDEATVWGQQQSHVQSPEVLNSDRFWFAEVN